MIAVGPGKYLENGTLKKIEIKVGEIERASLRRKYFNDNEQWWTTL